MPFLISLNSPCFCIILLFYCIYNNVGLDHSPHAAADYCFRPQQDGVHQTVLEQWGGKWGMGSHNIRLHVPLPVTRSLTQSESEIVCERQVCKVKRFILEEQVSSKTSMRDKREKLMSGRQNGKIITGWLNKWILQNKFIELGIQFQAPNPSLRTHIEREGHNCVRVIAVVTLRRWRRVS